MKMNMSIGELKAELFARIPHVYKIFDGEIDIDDSVGIGWMCRRSSEGKVFFVAQDEEDGCLG